MTNTTNIQIDLESKYDYDMKLVDFLFENLPTGWEKFFISNLELLKEISEHVYNDHKNRKIIYPDFEKVFRIFYNLKPEDITVLLLGQDPYHDGSAVGYAFSVKGGRKLNSSLINIKKEVVIEKTEQTGTSFEKYSRFVVSKNNGDLSNWVKQGVFLLNTALTVVKGEPESHLEVWKKFSEAVIKDVTKQKNLAIILFGRKAQQFESCVSCHGTHVIIKTPHPSGFSANGGFFHSNCFTRANVFLEKVGKNIIDFSV